MEFGDWIEWSGGECPVEPGRVINARCRDGDESLIQSCDWFDWRHNVKGEYPGFDIVAYRVSI